MEKLTKKRRQLAAVFMKIIVVPGGNAENSDNSKHLMSLDVGTSNNDAADISFKY